MWTGVSIIMLLAGICAMVWWYASQKRHEETGPLPRHGPSRRPGRRRPSQRATLKYFWVVAALILVQILMGVITAHYGVEGGGFYGIKLADWLPYSVTRTWHIQTGLFWIATAWLAAGLFIGPLVSGVEPKGQKLGVNVLFLALFAGGGRLADRGVAEHQEQAHRRDFVPVGASGLRVHRPGPGLASGCCSSGCCSGCSWWCARCGPR